jgi:hypothetical protein
MKAGSEYEAFVYEKLRRLFPDAVVTLNDHLIGRESDLRRQIDVSLRMKVDSQVELLYIVQCKDLASPTDITVMGEFASVMRDVGAAKGFLLCTSGFAKSNHTYARAMGIELLTIEDIKSDKWSVEIDIPLVYTTKSYQWTIDLGFEANEALVAANRDQALLLSVTGETLLTTDGGATTISLESHLKATIEDPAFNGAQGEAVELIQSGLQVLLAGVWAPCNHLSAIVNVEKKRYLKYLKPDDYAQLRDHVRGTRLPLHLAVSGITLNIDESFVELADDETPVTPGLWFDVESWTQIERSEGRGSVNQ